jgi:hypothetical protein
MKRYTVIGVFLDLIDEDKHAQRYSAYFSADDAEHAEEQARDEGGDSLWIAGVVEGEAAMADVN